jgi:ammonia channel protein AmtB
VTTVLQVVGAVALVAIAFYAGCIVGVAVALSAALEPDDAADNLQAHRCGGIGDLNRHRHRCN